MSYNIILSKCIQASIVHAPARLHMSTIALQILQCTNCTIHIYRAPTNKESNASRNAPTPLGGAFSHLFSTQTLPLMQFLPSRLLVPRGACATRLPGRRKAPGSGGNLISEPAPPGNKMKLRKNVLLDEGSAGWVHGQR